jgi:hypothetical protein
MFFPMSYFIMFSFLPGGTILVFLGGMGFWSALAVCHSLITLLGVLGRGVGAAKWSCTF